MVDIVAGLMVVTAAAAEPTGCSGTNGGRGGAIDRGGAVGRGGTNGSKGRAVGSGTNGGRGEAGLGRGEAVGKGGATIGKEGRLPRVPSSSTSSE